MGKFGVGPAVLGGLVLAALAMGGLLSMTGTLRSLISPPLTAEVRLAQFELPSGFGLDPQEVADFLVKDLTKRAETDIAVRLAMGPEAQARLIEIGIPRLVSSTVVRDMIRDIPPLARVLSVAEFKIAARITIANRGEARSDVALTLPGAVLAEADSGTVAISTTSSGLTALSLGDMAAGEERVLRVWLGQAALDAGAALGQSVLLGDGAGQTGRVWIYDQANWQGADLQAIPPARWMIAAVLLLVFVTAALTAAFGLMSALRRRAVNPA
jgi:hypothetical protein